MKEVKNRIANALLGLEMKARLREGRTLVSRSIEGGAVKSGAIDLFSRDRNVKEAFELWCQSTAVARRLASIFPEGTDDLVIDNFVDGHPTMLDAQDCFERARKSLSMAQLGALLQLQGEKLQEDLDRFGL